MASYINTLLVNGKPAKAVLVRLHNKSGGLVETAVTDKFGQYSFTGVSTGTYDIRFYGNRLHPVDWLYDVQIFDADEIEAKTEALIAEDYLSQYSWGDSLFISDLANNGLVSYGFYPDGTTIQLSDGFFWHDAAGGLGTAVITITNKVTTEVIPYNTLTLREPIAYKGNRTDIGVSSTGTFTGGRSHSYITRIVQPGIPGVAKCDFLHEDGSIISQDNIIFQSTPILINSGVSFTFDDNAPLYLHDSWATRAIVPQITKLSVFADFQYNDLLDSARVILNATGDQYANLEANINTVDIAAADFGTTLNYGVDWNDDVGGKEFHIQLRVTRTDYNEKIRIYGLYAVIGDSEEYDYWDVGDV